jgi:hypothetical protein
MFSTSEIIKATRANNGATFDGSGLLDYASGYMVGLSDNSLTARIDDTSTLAGLLDSVVSDGGTWGTWNDDGTVYIDPVVNVRRKSDAVALAQAHNQLAIWDVRHAREVRIG